MGSSNYKIVYERKTVNQVWAEDSKLIENIKGNYRYNKLNQAYLEAYNGDDFFNNSIIILNNSIPILIIPSFSKSNNLSYFNEPSELIHILDNNGALHNAQKLLFNFLKSADSSIEKILIDSNAISGKMYYKYLEDIDNIFEGTVDLTLTEEVIYSSIRKSYKSLINWGRNTLRLEVLNMENPSYSAFMAFKNLHRISSGYKTRSDKTWEIQYQMIKAGQAFHINAFDETNKLVCGVFILHDSKNAFYGVAAGDRNLMEVGKPIGHWPLYKAISCAKRINCSTFKFGRIDNNTKTDKDHKINNISFFKSGFCTDINLRTNFHLNFKL